MFTLPKGREGPQYPSVSRQKSARAISQPDALGHPKIMTTGGGRHHG